MLIKYLLFNKLNIYGKNLNIYENFSYGKYRNECDIVLVLKDFTILKKRQKYTTLKKGKIK